MEGIRRAGLVRNHPLETPKHAAKPPPPSAAAAHATADVFVAAPTASTAGRAASLGLPANPWEPQTDEMLSARLYTQELTKRGTSDAAATPEVKAAALAAAQADFKVIRAAEAISQRCQANPGLEITPNETQILYKAVELQTGVPARLMKAISYGEALGSLYKDGVPRQFYDLAQAPGMASRAKWAKNILGVDLPVLLGDDRSFGSPTCGIGLFQLTADISKIKTALAHGGTVMNTGGGSPGGWYKGPVVTWEPRRAIVDPYYNLLVGAQIVNHKLDIYTAPNRPGGPIGWMPKNPTTDKDWAIVASTVSTFGGYGPAGQAWKRIYGRLTDSKAASWGFVSGEPVVP
jgi:hypothetical protein